MSNVIWEGPADFFDKPLTIEGIATEAILPGALTLIEADGSGVSLDTNAATVFGSVPMLAQLNNLQAGDRDTAWEVGQTLVNCQPRSGEFFQVRCADAQVITRGAGLSCNGDGTLKVAATDGSEDIHFYARETVTTTAAGQFVAVRGA